MEVTNSNFDEVLPTLSEVFKKAAFIALDTEYTGLRAVGDAFFFYDSPQERYNSLRLRATQFITVQYGIAAFFHNTEENRFSYQAYNFLVFPPASTKTFTCQVSTLRFLAENNLDFNKVFRDGIPFLSPGEMTEKLAALKLRSQRSEEQARPAVVRVPEEQKLLLGNVMKRVDDFWAGDEKEATLPFYTAAVRRLIYQTCREKFGNKLTLETNRDETMTLLKELSVEDRKKRQQNREEEDRARVYAQVGFTKVVDLLIQAGKPIVGHNLLSDLMFTIQQFVEPLPAYETWLKLCHRLFPVVYDTKIMASRTDLKGITESSLQGVVAALGDVAADGAGADAVAAEAGFGFDAGDAHHHAAAYDAYLTGVAFLGLAKKLGGAAVLSSAEVRACANKLSIASMFGVPFLDLAARQPEPDRSHVFHLQVPEAWNKVEVDKFFKQTNKVAVKNLRWINSTSLVVETDPTSVEKMRELTRNTEGECRVQPFCAFRATLDACEACGQRPAV